MSENNMSKENTDKESELLGTQETQGVSSEVDKNTNSQKKGKAMSYQIGCVSCMKKFNSDKLGVVNCPHCKSQMTAV